MSAALSKCHQAFTSVDFKHTAATSCHSATAVLQTVLVLSPGSQSTVVVELVVLRNSVKTTMTGSPSLTRLIFVLRTLTKFSDARSSCGSLPLASNTNSLTKQYNLSWFSASVKDVELVRRDCSPLVL